MKTTRWRWLTGISALLLVSCGQPQDGENAGALSDRRITSEQLALADVQTSAMEYRVISSTIACTGEIEIPPRGMASVTAPMGGYIVEADVVPGRFVQRGELLAKLSNPEYVVLQQSYLETAGQLKFAGQEYERQKTLVQQNAAALKKLQESESSFNVLKARLAGLRGQLDMIGVNIRQLEEGKIQSEIPLRSPLTGYVTEVNHHKGQFVEPREAIFRIVDLSDLHLHLNVFEKDIGEVRKDQKIRFRPAGETGEPYRAHISLVSPRRNDESRTFDVHGHIDKGSERLKPGMYVEAEILVTDDSVYAVEEKALVFRNGNVYVLTENGEGYDVIQVETGVTMDGWVEIRNYEALVNKTIVTEGSTRLFTALQQ